MASTLRRLLSAGLALILFATACGGSDRSDDVPASSAAAAEPPAHEMPEGGDSSDMAGMNGTAGTVEGGGSGHNGDSSHHGDSSHGGVREIAGGALVPTIDIDISEDAREGWNLRIHTTNFRIVPENVSTTHVDGEGHMHLYIDGVKISRIYGEWHHIGVLEPGEHDVRVELSSNDHSTLVVDGDPVDATATIVASEAGRYEGDHELMQPAVEPHPSLNLEIIDDPAGGWSLRATPANFRLAPERVSGEHVDGEGHMRLYINGVGVARLYEIWNQMPPLPAGTHEISVGLWTNDYRVVAIDGWPVVAITTLEVSEAEATMQAGNGDETGATGSGGGHHGSTGAATPYDANVSDAAQTITVEVVGGAPVGGHQRVEVELGSVVAVMVTSDTAEEVHVHGYDILRAVSDGHPAHFAFNTEIPGVFEVELEGSGRLLLQLQIS